MIVDASVAIKWLVAEENTDIANGLIGSTYLAAPELIACEVANGVWKKWARKELASVPQRLPFVLQLFDEIFPVTPFAFRAAELAIELNHPAYDCFYLALAEARGDVVVTADARFIDKLAPTSYKALVMPLAGIAT
jgi:predicted nucleic acid-binding protein